MKRHDRNGTARQVMGLGTMVGGRMGRRLREAAALAVQTPGQPDLSTRTKDLVGSQVSRYLDALGGFTPDSVAISVMKRMRLDPQIQLALAATKAPILGATVFFESASREAVALCEEVWVKTGLLRELMRTSLQAIDFGFAAHEKLWEVAEMLEVSWNTPGSIVGVMEAKTKTYPTLFVPRRAKDLDPSRVTLLRDEFGNFAGVLFGTRQGQISTQQDLLKFVRSQPDNTLLPEKAFVFTENGEWGNLYGRGRLVAAYDPWYWQRIIYLVCNRWYERKSDPPYVGFAPTDPTLTDPGPDEEDDYDAADENYSPILKLRKLITNGLRSSGVIVLPSEPYKDDNGKPTNVRAYDLKEIGVEDVHPAFLAYIQHLDSKKTRALLLPDGAIAASENTGTYGSTRALSDVAINIQNETLTSWVRHFNRYFLQPFLAFNGITDRVTLTTTGISSDNRDVLLKLIDKTYEADMLLEQAWGPQFPDSLSRLIKRRGLLRALNVPFEEPEPGSPPPEMPEPPPRPEGADKEAPKRKTGLAMHPGEMPMPGMPPKGMKKKKKKRKKMMPESEMPMKPAMGGRGARQPFRLDVASDEFDGWAQEEAEALEARVRKAQAESPYENTLETHEKALIAVLLWFLLRSDKTDKSGKRRKGTTDADDLVFDASGDWLAPADLVLVLPELERLAMEMEGRGWRLAPGAGTNSAMNKARGGMEATLDGLPESLTDALDPDVYLAPAVAAGHAAVTELLARFDPQHTMESLDEEEAASIVAANARGLLWNVENISIRNSRSAFEGMLNAAGNKRLLGAVAEARATRFNALYSDLSTASHFRAVIRGVMVALAEKNGYPFLLKKTSKAGGETMPAYDGQVKTIEDWDRISDGMGAPDAIRQFGFHHGSLSFWFPVPTRARRNEKAVAMALAYLGAKRAKETTRVDTGR